MTTIHHDFERGLERGIFLIPRCAACGKTVWPLAEFCSSCMGMAILERGSKEDHRGIITECVKDAGRGSCSMADVKNEEDKTERFICMVSLACGIRIIAHMDSHTEPKPEDSVTLTECSVDHSGQCHVYGVTLCSQAHLQTDRESHHPHQTSRR